MAKTAKIIYSAAGIIFTLLILFALTVIAIEKTTDNTFFINETFCSYRVSPFLVLWLGVLGDACLALTVCIRKKAKRILTILSAAVIVFSLFSVIISVAGFAADRYFYHESSPNGKNEIIITSQQFLVAGFGDVYYRVNPFFIRRLKNEENKHVEWFYDDYTVEWHDKYVMVDGYTYLLPER